MLVPRYWAEHRIQLREGSGPQTTIRRWGWSGTSQAEADHHARQRAEAVMPEHNLLIFQGKITRFSRSRPS